MGLARLLPLEHVLVDRLFLELVPSGEHAHLRFPALQLVNDAAPAAEASDVLVGGGAVDELEQRRRATVEDREQKPEAERIRVLADRFAEVPRDLGCDLPQRFLLAE